MLEHHRKIDKTAEFSKKNQKETYLETRINEKCQLYRNQKGNDYRKGRTVFMEFFPIFSTKEVINFAN